METKWILLLLAVWGFLLFTAYSKYRRQLAAVLSNQEVVAAITKKILAGQSDEQVVSSIKQDYKVSGMAAVSSLAQIKKALKERQARKAKDQ